MKKKSLLIILAINAFLVGLDSLVVSPIIPEISASTGTTLAKCGLLITAYALFYGLTAPLFGPISDKIGRKKMIVIGMFLFAIGTFLTGITNDFTTILASRALTGVAAAIVMPSIFALVGDLFPDKQRGMAMGTVMGAMIASTVLGVPMGAFLTKWTDWQTTFFLIGIIAFLFNFTNLVKLPRTLLNNQTSISPVKEYFGVFIRATGDRSVLFALLATLLWTIGLHGMFAYIGVFYEQNFNLTVDKIGIVIFLAGLASVLGNILGGKWSDRIGKKKVIYLASVFAAVFVLMFSSLTEALFFAVFIHILWSASIGFGQSSLTSLIAGLSPQARGTVMALNSSAMYLGMTFASGLSSILLKEFTFLAVGVVCALSVLIVLPAINQINKLDSI